MLKKLFSAIWNYVNMTQRDHFSTDLTLTFGPKCPTFEAQGYGFPFLFGILVSFGKHSVISVNIYLVTLTQTFWRQWVYIFCSFRMQTGSVCRVSVCLCFCRSQRLCLSAPARDTCVHWNIRLELQTFFFHPIKIHAHVKRFSQKTRLRSVVIYICEYFIFIEKNANLFMLSRTDV